MIQNTKADPHGKNGSTSPSLENSVRTHAPMQGVHHTYTIHYGFYMVVTTVRLSYADYLTWRIVRKRYEYTHMSLAVTPDGVFIIELVWFLCDPVYDTILDFLPWHNSNSCIGDVYVLDGRIHFSNGGRQRTRNSSRNSGPS